MKEPVISLFAAAKRVSNWRKFIQHTERNDTSFEVIFVGPNQPHFNLPSNWTYIYSNVKPAQCYYIAYKHCRGKYVLNTCDDVLFFDNALDRLLDNHQGGKEIVSPTYFRKKKSGFWGSNDLPLLPAGSLVRRNRIEELGGIDSSFIALYWDCDLAMRNYHDGGEVITVSDAEFFERQSLKTNRLYRLEDCYDRTLFYHLWHKTSVPYTNDFREERLRPVVPFKWSEDVLSVSQGETHPNWP